MKGHGGRLIAPIVITVLIVLYYIGLIVAAAATDWLPPGWLIAGSLIPLALAGAMIYMLIERIKEIRSGEEDDLSQY